MTTPFFLLIQFSILAYALVAGVFLAFSDFIMRALANTSGVGGEEAMQIINKEVFRWIFMTLFLGMAAVSILIAVLAWINVGGTAGLLIVLAALVYLIGCFGVTVIFNVPMNEALAGMDLSSDTTHAYWIETYVPRWTFWNGVRTGAATLSAAILLFGLTWMNPH